MVLIAVTLVGKRLLWWVIFLLPIYMLIQLGIDAFAFRLGADPAKEIVQQTGLWAMWWLWLTLAVTPLSRLAPMRWLMRFRRMLGLYAAFLAFIHLLAFCAFILGWRADLILKELSERIYIVAGLLALILMMPLVVTSTKKMQKRLGRRWKRLHQLVYLCALLVLIHYVLQVRASYADQLLYGVLLAVLLGWRVFAFYRKTGG